MIIEPLGMNIGSREVPEAFVKFARSSRGGGMIVLLSALLISFLGSLPPGTTNILTVQLTATNGIFPAAMFSFGCLIAEAAYVIVCLLLMDKILQYSYIIKWLRWVSLGVLIALAIASFVSASGKVPVVAVDNANGSPFLFGFLLMIINPVQAPFWLGWTTLLLEKKILKGTTAHYVVYALGACLGSIMASTLFIVAGQYVLESGLLNVRVFHYAAGSFFLLSAAGQAVGMIRDRSDGKRLNSKRLAASRKQGLQKVTFRSSD